MEYNQSLVSAMNQGKPYKSYRKTILGQVHINILNPMKNFEPMEHILKGNPSTNPMEEGCIIDVWSEMEDLYFRRQNKRHFDTGVIIPFNRPKETPKVEVIEQAGDDKLREILDMKWFAFVKAIGEINSEAVAYRLLVLAESEEKSFNMVTAIQNRLTQLQTGEVKSE